MTTDDFAKYHHDHVHRSFLDPLTLRAEVEALRNINMGVPAALSAYQTVLDLIDKHAREGQ